MHPNRTVLIDPHYGPNRSVVQNDSTKEPRQTN